MSDKLICALFRDAYFICKCKDSMTCGKKHNLIVQNNDFLYLAAGRNWQQLVTQTRIVTRSLSFHYVRYLSRLSIVRLVRMLMFQWFYIPYPTDPSPTSHPESCYRPVVRYTSTKFGRWKVGEILGRWKVDDFLLYFGYGVRWMVGVTLVYKL